MKLFCWIIDKSEASFPVDVQNDDTVGDLKKAVLKEKPHTLASLDADQLNVWKPEVSIKITKDLRNEVSKYQLVDNDSLLESDILSDAFPNPVQGYLHVVVQTPFVVMLNGIVLPRPQAVQLIKRPWHKTTKSSCWHRVYEMNALKCIFGTPAPAAPKSVVAFSTIITMLSYINRGRTFNSFTSPDERNQRKLATLNALAVLLARNFEAVAVSSKNSESKHLEVVACVHKARFVEGVIPMQSGRLGQRILNVILGANPYADGRIPTADIPTIIEPSPPSGLGDLSIEDYIEAEPHSFTFHDHVWIISTLLTQLKSDVDQEKGLLLLQEYVVAACHEKMQARLHHKILSKHFITSLKEIPTSNLEFPGDLQAAGSANDPDSQYDKIFLSFLSSIETTKPIPNLRKQAEAAGRGELYTKETQKEFHSFLCDLLDKYVISVDKLASWSSGSAEYKDALLNVVASGGTLFQLSTTAAIKKHLQAIEPHLQASRNKRDVQVVEPSTEEMSREIEIDPDLCSVQPTAVHEEVFVPLWQSYLNWLKLMVGHFEAVWILSAYINNQKFLYDGISIKVLVPPRVSEEILSWRSLLESEHFPSTTLLMDGASDKKTQEIISFLEDWSDPSRGFVSFEPILLEVKSLSGSSNFTPNISSITRQLYALTKRVSSSQRDHIQMVISKAETLKEHTEQSGQQDAIGEITRMLSTLSSYSLLFKDLQRNSLAPGQRLTGSLHCGLNLGSLISLSRSKTGRSDGRYKPLLNQLRGGQSLIGMSQRCCPVCAYVLSMLPEGSFVVREPYGAVIPCALPTWLPEEFVKTLNHIFGSRLKRELIQMMNGKLTVESRTRMDFQKA